MTTILNPTPSFLVVDDSKVSRTIVVALLRARLPQARFDEAADGAAAVEQFQRQPAQTVIMDFNMPGINGIEAAERILAIAPGTAIVLLTANAQSAVQSKADAAGVQLMRKPIKPELADQIVAIATAQAARTVACTQPQTVQEAA